MGEKLGLIAFRQANNITCLSTQMGMSCFGEIMARQTKKHTFISNMISIFLFANSNFEINGTIDFLKKNK